MVKSKSSVSIIFRQRILFFSEVLIVLFGLFFFLRVPSLVSLFLDEGEAIFGPLYFSVKAIAYIIGIPIMLYIANFALEARRRTIILAGDISPTRSFLNSFKITKANFRYQILYGILLLFLIFIPLDFFTYLLLPESLEYFAILLADPYNSYLLQPYSIFLISGLIIQISVAIFEESFVRGFLANRGSDYIPKMSAVIISSFYFGLGHFAYIFFGMSPLVPIFFLFIWFSEAFFLGIILALFFLRKRWIFPCIFAHAINNIITIHAIWNFLQGNSFINLSLVLYTPLLVVSVVLFIWQFSRIKESLLSGLKEFISYFKNDKNIRENSVEKVIRIMLDFLIGLIIFAIGIYLL